MAPRRAHRYVGEAIQGLKWEALGMASAIPFFAHGERAGEPTQNTPTLSFCVGSGGASEPVEGTQGNGGALPQILGNVKKIRYTFS